MVLLTTLVICSTRSLKSFFQIKGTYSRRRNDAENPFSRGNFVKNCRYALCVPLPPSVMKRREYATQAQIEEFETSQANRSRQDRWNGGTYGGAGKANRVALKAVLLYYDVGRSHSVSQSIYTLKTTYQLTGEDSVGRIHTV